MTTLALEFRNLLLIVHPMNRVGENTNEEITCIGTLNFDSFPQ